MTYEYNAFCYRVVDGDTIDCAIDLGFDIHINQRVRLLGINAPESRTRDDAEKRRGIEAKNWLLNAIGDGHILLQTRYDKRGKFGRVLGVVLKDGVDLNQAMIDQGHAKVYR